MAEMIRKAYHNALYSQFKLNIEIIMAPNRFNNEINQSVYLTTRFILRKTARTIIDNKNAIKLAQMTPKETQSKELNKKINHCVSTRKNNPVG